uniref:BED-type domain-containing protein n=1 Tax=Meloidogyne hapla TaxID=6305 RepID=A0A1I8BN66_MELHA
MPPEITSPTWEFFSKNGTKVICKLCNRQLVCHVSDMRKHLKTIHQQELPVVEYAKNNNVKCHLFKSCGYSNFYLEEWSRAFMEAPTDNTTEEFENFVNKDRGEYSVYLVRSGPTLKHLVYVGITAIKDLKYRFSDHGHIDKFSNYKNLQRAVFLPKMSKTTAEIVEPLIIMSSKTNKKMLNTRKEVRNLNQLDVPDEPFHERVMRYHKMVVNLLARRWEELKWEDFSAEQQPTSSSSIQITTTPNIQQCKRRSNQELLEELEAKDKPKRNPFSTMNEH